jgi:hypothetical protein
MKLVRNFLHLWADKTPQKSPVDILSNGNSAVIRAEKNVPGNRELFRNEPLSLGKMEYAAPEQDPEIQYC